MAIWNKHFWHSNDGHFGFDQCCWNVFYWICWPWKHKFGYQKHISSWSRNKDTIKIRFDVWTRQPFWKMTFFQCWTLFETVTRSNIFADIRIYQIRSRNLICLIWRRKIIFFQLAQGLNGYNCDIKFSMKQGETHKPTSHFKHWYWVLCGCHVSVVWASCRCHMSVVWVLCGWHVGVGWVLCVYTLSEARLIRSPDTSVGRASD